MLVVWMLAGSAGAQEIRYVSEVEGRGPGFRLRIRHRADDLARVLAARPGARIFVSNYPHLPLKVNVPPGRRLREIVPRVLWELVPDPPGGR